MPACLARYVQLSGADILREAGLPSFRRARGFSAGAFALLLAEEFVNRSRAEEKAFRSASRFAGRLDDFGRIPGGMESEAYFFRKGSEEYVLRVNRDRAGIEN